MGTFILPARRNGRVGREEVVSLFGFLKKSPKKFHVPSVATKAGAKELSSYKRMDFGPGVVSRNDAGVLFSREHDGVEYDFAFVKKPKAKRLFVLFCGAADRKKIDPPVFQRWKWADRFPGHVLYVSDPALKLSKGLGLAWYIGTKETDYMPFIKETILELAEYLKLSERQVVSYGSSGGGFAALRLLDFMPQMTAVAINPQIKIAKYNRHLVNLYLKTCQESQVDDFDFEKNARRFDLAAIPRSDNSRMIICQNVRDEFHYHNHFKDYCATLGISSEHSVSTTNVHTILFEDDGGHVRAETSELFTRIMNLI